MPFLLLQLFGDRNAWSRLNTWEAKDAWRACFGRCLSASTIFSSDSAVQVYRHLNTSGPSVCIPDRWTLGTEIGTQWIVSETPVSAIRLGHLGFSWCRASCHSHFPCSFKSAHCPLLLGVPRDHLCWDTLGPPARLPRDTPCPASSVHLCLLPISPL